MGELKFHDPNTTHLPTLGRLTELRKNTIQGNHGLKNMKEI